MTQVFKVGDRVRAVETCRANQITEGQEFTITNVVNGDVNEGPLLYGDDGLMGVFASRFEKVEEPKFKVGDRVRWSGSPGSEHRVLGRAGDIDHKDGRYDWRVENVASGLRLNAYDRELTKIGVPFKPERGDKVVNLKTGREGIVLMGQVWDRDCFTAEPVPVKALVEYEEHFPGTYDLIKKDAPW